MVGESKWSKPSKKIFDGADLPRFRKSIAYKKIQFTLSTVIDKVKGCEVPNGALNIDIVTRKEANIPPPLAKKKECNFEAPSSNDKAKQVNHEEKEIKLSRAENYNGVLKILKKLNDYIDQNPPLSGPRRFGNLACRSWHDAMAANMEALLKDNLKLDKNHTDIEGFIKEIKYYLENSFGSKLRLDYGTGHELSFLAFLGGLIYTNTIEWTIISGADVLFLFAKYYDLTRRLILTYSLEPAGSHGVWGLDDHFHLIYIIGAAQFNSTKDKIVPPVLQVLSSRTITSYKLENFYVNAVAFIFKIKLGPFHEHSPIIYDIHSTVTLWSKVLSGLIKMYEAEVLGKYPVVQHFWFGSTLYPWRDHETNQDLPVYQQAENKEDEENEDIGFLNSSKGINTTRTNISMTGAPWAMNNTTRPTTGRFQPPKRDMKARPGTSHR